MIDRQLSAFQVTILTISCFRQDTLYVSCEYAVYMSVDIVRPLYIRLLCTFQVTTSPYMSAVYVMRQLYMRICLRCVYLSPR